MGEYLQWFYETLVASAPAKVEIVHHHTEAVDIVACADGRERVLLADGRRRRGRPRHLDLGSHRQPRAARQPVRSWPGLTRSAATSATIPRGATVAIEGMGLVATDVLMALTVGRGGSFVENGDRLRYVSIGRRTGTAALLAKRFPLLRKGGRDRRRERRVPRPSSAPRQAIGAIQGGLDTGRPRRQIDFRSAVLPLILAEMQIRYYSQSALLKSDRHDAEVVGSSSAEPGSDGSFPEVVRRLSASYGEFDPRLHFFGPRGDYVSSKDYESQIYSMVEDDLRESLRGGSAPVKSAYEVLRHVRDLMRTVIEFQGLTLESYLDFRDNIKTRVNRLVAGPPALRSKQLLALIDADVVTVPFGPLPAINPSGDKGFMLRSRRFEQPHVEQVDWLIHGHLENPTLCRSSSPLLQRLCRQGRIKPLSYGDTDVGSVALSEDFHPIDAWEQPAARIWVFGSLTEGVRYFTHYVPSPKSRLRAFLDAQRCVEEILG